MTHVVSDAGHSASPRMITIDEHRQRILDAVTPLPAELLPLSAARGRALAAEVRSRWPLPLFDASAMDGYAVRQADAVSGAILRVIADVPAGAPDDPALGPGEAARIMTGAPVPSDADAIVPLEHTDLGTAVRHDAPESVTVLTAAAHGAHIRRAGEDRGAGEVVVDAGAELKAWQLAAIASCGYDRVLVGSAPRVAVISTGTELVPPASTPDRGQIPESNSVLLAAAVADAGGNVTAVRSVPDDPALLRRTVQGVLDVADVVILTGGASVGAFDVVKAVMGPEYGIRFDSVSMQPGKPQGFGLHHGALVFCLPGSPLGMAVSFEVFVRPALRALAGHRDVERRRSMMPASGSWRVRAGKTQLLPVVFDGDRVEPATQGNGFHPISSLAVADALAIIPADVDAVLEGDLVSVMLL
ncbi:gephyrin-like molybdotransferase Glp [Microbacterium sp.]|uniref:molybdopterin molybdotransferase MoeA n=1 Tax=Microbacterium sp. TaxID=51671 RepID=UPI0025E64B8C|nr:gephyrin-like molybdotransferase Glp [Microbacterium sp.]